MMRFTVDDLIEHGLWLSRAVCLGTLIVMGEGLAGAYAAVAFFVGFAVMAVLSFKEGVARQPSTHLV